MACSAFKGRLRWWLFAPAVTAILVAASFLISFAMAPELLVGRAGFEAKIAGLAGIPDVGRSAETRLGVALLITLVLGPIVNLPIFLGEEVGWRGFMTPRLTALYGRRGLIVAGTIWAVWHTPLILMGHNYPHHPWLGHLVWIPHCIAMSILLQAAYGAGRSIFAPALAHGVLNQLASLGMMVLIVDGRYIDWLHGPAGLAGLLAVAAPACWIYLRRPDLLLWSPLAASDGEGAAASAPPRRAAI